MKTFVLDTSSLLSMYLREPGMETVVGILKDARKGRCQVYASAVSQLEVFYKIYRQDSKEEAYRVHMELKTLPLEFVPIDEDIILRAGEYKTECSFSLADAIVAATACQMKATLVHKDPEFEALTGQVAMESLPYKKSSRSMAHSND